MSKTSEIARIKCQYGLWPSVLSPKSMAGGKRFLEVQWDSDGRTLLWVEGQSDQTALFCVDWTTADAPRQLTSDLPVRAKVGYGGGDFTASHGVAVFAEGTSGRLYSQKLASGAAAPLSPPFGAAASPVVSPDGRFVAYVHHDKENVDRLIVADMGGQQWPQVFASGHDFYAQLRFSLDGRRLAFIAWDHPQMPWDGAYLYLADVVQVEGGLPILKNLKRIAGSTDTSVAQPEFSRDGKTVVFISDASGFGQLHVHDIASGRNQQLTRVEGAVFGAPNWIQGQRTFGLLGDGKSAVAAVNQSGFVRLHTVDLTTGAAVPIASLRSYSAVSQVTLDSSGERIAFFGSSPEISGRLVAASVARDFADVRIVARVRGETLSPGDLAKPEAISWESADGEMAHGLFYLPASNLYAPASSGSRPPLIVIVHGGPTSQFYAGYSPDALFFTTRGYGVLYVNHRGSTGYGRAYMLKQRGAWGKVDVEDSVAGADYLGRIGRIDRSRAVIMGGSAGGYTVLQTMVDQPEAFAAGISLYGIANQFSLAADTHKFEARYTDSLLGPLPEAAALYRERSPVFHAAKIKRPLAVFQGTEDKVVPQNQSDMIVKAVQRLGIPHVYHLYPGEGHGFRKAETIEHYYGAIDAFLKENVILS